MRAAADGGPGRLRQGSHRAGPQAEARPGGAAGQCGDLEALRAGPSGDGRPASLPPGAGGPDLFLESQAEAPEEIWLDLDAIDDPTHGQQEGRFYHGYYREHCYLPLYIFCEHHALCARLRTVDRDASDGSVEELERIVGRIRERWPATRIRIRADAGFCRDGILSWCEANAVGYMLGLARNPVLTRCLRHAMRRARRCCWQTGEMENRIKEQQLCLFADRTSSATMRANQLRLYLSTFAYVLINTVREVGLAGTAMAKAQCSTIRLKLFKIAAVVRITTRKVWLSLSSVHPFQHLYATALRNLRALPHAPPLAC